MKSKCLLSCVLYVVCCMAAISQTNIKGRVIDSQTGKAVVGANIRIDDSMSKGVTDGKGEFSIGNLRNGRHLLSITHVSYQPRSIEVEGTSTDLLIKMDESHINLSQVVVTGTGTHHRMKDSPVAVNVLTSQDIKGSNVMSFQETLQKLSPSFSLFENGMGSSLMMNGLSDNYYVFLLNGRRMSGDDTFSRINVSNIKRVEILNGAFSTLYGTNAIGGVVNIITDDSKNGIDVSSDTKVMNKGRFDQSFNIDLSGSRYSSYTTYNHHRQDNWQLSPYEEKKDGSLVETNKIASTGYHSDNLRQRFTYNANDRLSFDAGGQYYHYKTDRPYDVYKYDVDHTTYSYDAGMKYLVSKKAYLTADYNADNYVSKYDYYRESGNYAVGDKITRKRTMTHDATLKGVFTMNETHHLSLGLDYLYDILKSEMDNIDKESAYTLSLFAQDEIKIGKGLRALLGLRYLYHENFHNYATPNVSLSYQTGNIILRGNYASGYKAPTLSELYATDIAKTIDRQTIGNKDLKPEKNNYISVGGEYNNSRLSFTANGFLNRVRDMIDYVTIATGETALSEYGHSEVRQRTNVNHARIYGVNCGLNAYLGMGMSLSAGYTWLDAIDTDLDKPLDKSIRNSATLGLKWGHTWRNYNLKASINGRIYSKRYSKTYGYAPNYQIWDLSTCHRFALNSIIIEPSVGIENIFDYTDDRPYNSNYATLNPGRSFYVGLSLRFKD